METFALVTAAAVGLWVLWIILGSRAEPESVDEPNQNGLLLSSLVHQLSGEPEKDEPILNRILALGVDGIPVLLQEIIRRRRDDEARHSQVISALERVICHFGIAAIPGLCQQLARLQSASPLTPHIFRIVDKLGAVGSVAAAQYGLVHVGLKSGVYRYTKNIDSDGLISVLNGTEDKDFADCLDLCASRLSENPAILNGLWTRSAPHRRALIMRWLRDWLPVCRPDFILQGLSDVTRSVRIEAAHIARVIVDPDFIEPLNEMMKTSRTCRIAAIHALCAQDIRATETSLRRATNDADPEVAVPAMLRLLEYSSLHSSIRWQLGAAFVDTPLEGIRFQDFKSASDIPLDILFQTLDETGHAHKSAAAHLLAIKSQDDPRARERLIRMADAHGTSDRVLAVHALSKVGDRTASDLLVRVLRSGDLADHQLVLQQAAQRIGPSIVPMIARRLGGASPVSMRVGLSVLRTLPYVDAVPSLLHALEENCDEILFVQVSNTLHVGGDPVMDAIEDALSHSEKGLLVPALRYKGHFPRSTDLPLIVELYEQHPALRPLLLNLMEGFGTDAITAIESRINRGGVDLDLLPLEARLSLMRACLGSNDKLASHQHDGDSREFR